MDTHSGNVSGVPNRPRPADLLAVATRLERLAACLPPELQAQVLKTVQGLTLHARFLRQKSPDVVTTPTEGAAAPER